MKKLARNYRDLFSQPEFAMAIFIGSFLLVASLIINFYAGIFATSNASNAVTDIILDNIPVFDVDLIFIYGPLALWLVVSILGLIEPKRLPFILKSIALFVLVRAIFITLTHIGPFPDRTVVNYSARVIRDFTFGGDLFFSAHTGLPFLMALVFWRHRYWRYFFILTSIFFGLIVLLGHLHYSIDVLAAFFITFSIYRLAEIFFPQDLRWFRDQD